MSVAIPDPSHRMIGISLSTALAARSKVSKSPPIRIKTVGMFSPTPLKWEESVGSLWISSSRALRTNTSVPLLAWMPLSTPTKLEQMGLKAGNLSPGKTNSFCKKSDETEKFLMKKLFWEYSIPDDSFNVFNCSKFVVFLIRIVFFRFQINFYLFEISSDHFFGIRNFNYIC